MLYTTTPTGMRTLAGDYRDADRRWADARRADKTPTVAQAPSVERHIAPRRIVRLITLLAHAR